MRIAIVNQLDRLKGVFGGTHFSQERLRSIYNILEPYPDSWSVDIINTMIDNFKSAPLPHDFRTAVYGLSRARKVYEEQESVYQTKCYDCYDTGFIFCQMNVKSPEALATCHCQEGLNSEEAYRLTHTPRWELGKMEIVYGFIKKDFPLQKFIPEDKDIDIQNPDKNKDFRDKARRWGNKVRLNNEYWKKLSLAEKERVK